METYIYDSQNRLVGYASGTTTASYAYDAMERRIAKTVDGAGVAYIYDMSTDDPLAMDDITLEFSTGAIPVLNRRWAHSNAVDEPVGFEEYAASGPAGSGTERLMYADRQGSIRWVTDPVSDAVVAAYEYEGFGELTQTQGTLVQPYGYTGREYDVESRLLYLRTRWLDTKTAEFIQRDPLGFSAGQVNQYTYVDQNPFRFSDPTGRTPRAVRAGGLFAGRSPGMAGRLGTIAAGAARGAIGATGRVGLGAMVLTAKINRVLSAAKVANTVFSKGGEDEDDDSDECSPSTPDLPFGLDVDDLGKIKNENFDVPGTATPAEIASAIGFVLKSIADRESENRFFEQMFGGDDECYRHEERIKKEQKYLENLKKRNGSGSGNDNNC